MSDAPAYRPVPERDLNGFHRLLNYAFRPTETYEPIESIDEVSDDRF